MPEGEERKLQENQSVALSLCLDGLRYAMIFGGLDISLVESGVDFCLYLFFNLFSQW